MRWLEVGMKLERLAIGEPVPSDAARYAYRALWERLGGPELEVEAIDSMRGASHARA